MREKDVNLTCSILSFGRIDRPCEAMDVCWILSYKSRWFHSMLLPFTCIHKKFNQISVLNCGKITNYFPCTVLSIWMRPTITYCLNQMRWVRENKIGRSSAAYIFLVLYIKSLIVHLKETYWRHLLYLLEA